MNKLKRYLLFLVGLFINATAQKQYNRLLLENQ